MRVFLTCCVIMVLAGALIGGCNLFQTREPETPTNSGNIPFYIPIEPWIVLLNLKYTTEALVITNFDRSLATNYKFRFSSSDATLDTVWTKDRDIAALTALFQGKGATHLTWTPTDSGGTSTDRFYQNLRYRLVMRRSKTDTSRVVIVGQCNLYMHQDNGNWMVTRWEDNVDDPDYKTWGWARLNPNLPRSVAP